MLVQMSEEFQTVKLETERELEVPKQRQLVTEEELNTTKHELGAIKIRQLQTERELIATRGVLNTGNECNDAANVLAARVSSQMTSYNDVASGTVLFTGMLGFLDFFYSKSNHVSSRKFLRDNIIY